VVRQGYELNVPLQAQKAQPSGGTVEARHSYFGISGENVTIDCVKKAEDT